ncbi:MAG: hypothetical protein WDM96_09700 [Lacunisphaera sp.]
MTRTDDKWGVTTTTMNPLGRGAYEDGYRQGGNGGSLAIEGPVLALDGELVGATAAGPQQHVTAPTYVAGVGLMKSPLVPDWLINLNSLPAPARLAITIGRQELATDLGTPIYVERSPTPADVYFSDTPQVYNPVPRPRPKFLDNSFAVARGYEVDLHLDWFGLRQVRRTHARQRGRRRVARGRREIEHRAAGQIFRQPHGADRHRVGFRHQRFSHRAGGQHFPRGKQHDPGGRRRDRSRGV